MPQDNVPRLLVVAYSQSGRTRALTDAVVSGANDPACGGVDVCVRDPLDASPDDVRAASAYLFGTPENFGYMSGALKYFFDRIYYPCEEALAGRPYALFVSAGNDGTGAIRSVERIVSGLSLSAFQPPLLCVGDVTEEHLEKARELGMTAAAGLAAGVI